MVKPGEVSIGVLMKMPSQYPSAQKISFSAHCNDEKHSFSIKSVHLINQAKKDLRLKLLELLDIKRNLRKREIVTNEQTIFGHSV